MAVITISKEYATDSEKVALKLAKKLGYEYIGKKLAAQIAKDLNLSEGEVETFKKASQSRILRFMDRYTCSLVQKVVDREHGCLDDENYYSSTKKLVENLYDEDKMIILGWGGQCILRGKPNTLHVRLTKDDALKVKEVMKEQNISEKAAKEIIGREERDSSSYIKHYFNEDWNDSKLYDLVIDMGQKSLDQAVDMILSQLRQKTV